MPSDVMIDEVGRHIHIRGATDNNEATAEICVTTIQEGSDTEGTRSEYAETEQAGLASTVAYLRFGAEFKELVTELGRRPPEGTVPEG